jgi:hypothetical protein
MQKLSLNTTFEHAQIHNQDAKIAAAAFKIREVQIQTLPAILPRKSGSSEQASGRV